MLHLSYDSRSWENNSASIPPSRLHPKVLYTLSEKYAGSHERGDPQPAPQVLSWATIQKLADTWALHALRQYRVKWSKYGAEQLLLHIPGMVARVFH